MTEAFPRYGELRQPEYFFLKCPSKCYRLRVPWLCIQALIDIINTPQGYRSVPISWNYLPGPEITRLVSVGAALHVLDWAKEEGWIE